MVVGSFRVHVFLPRICNGRPCRVFRGEISDLNLPCFCNGGRPRNREFKKDYIYFVNRVVAKVFLSRTSQPAVKLLRTARVRVVKPLATRDEPVSLLTGQESASLLAEPISRGEGSWTRMRASSNLERREMTSSNSNERNSSRAKGGEEGDLQVDYQG